MENKYLLWPADKEDLIKILLFTGDCPVSTHKHDFIEVVFITNGSCSHIYHGTEVTLIPGDVFIITPHEEHSYSIHSKVTIYNCLFYPQALGDDWHRLKDIKGIYDLIMVEPFYRPELGQQEILHLQPSETMYIQSILKRLIDEQDAKLAGFQLMLKANLTILLSSLGRSWEKQFEDISRIYSGKREMLTDAINYIEKNFNDELKIDELASKSYLSPHYFRKLFKKVTQLTPIEYINKLRVSKAVQLLSENKLTISEISEMVGISDINYFSRLFRSRIGCSPTEFRKKNNLY